VRIRVRQIFFREDQRPELDRAFDGYANLENPRPELCEWYVIERLTRGGIPPDELFGVVSWKFRRKTGLSGDEFFAFVRSAPPSDVYFVSPFPDDRALWPSPWVQGEARHPGLLALVDRAFAALGYDRSLLRDWMPVESAAFCNFFVGNREFWERYLAYVGPVVRWLTETGPEDVRREVLEGADPLLHRGPFPFVVERLFGTFLENERRNGRPLRVAGYPPSEAWLSRLYGDFAADVADLFRLRGVLDGDPSLSRERVLEAIRPGYYRHRDRHLLNRSLEASVAKYQRALRPLLGLRDLWRRWVPA
jgi:hypothetical protein